jgi:hypothetical protein
VHFIGSVLCPGPVLFNERGTVSFLPGNDLFVSVLSLCNGIEAFSASLGSRVALGLNQVVGFFLARGGSGGKGDDTGEEDESLEVHVLF